MTIPIKIAKYIHSVWMSEMILTYLHIDHQGILVGWGGYPRHYGIPELTAGQSATEQISFLEGLLPVTRTQVLQFLCLEGGRYAHVHLVPFEEGHWILLMDATIEYEKQQKIQQQVNDLSLLSYRQSQLLQELETTRQMLAEENRQLEENSVLKSRFIASLSHELRTPLTSIVGYTKLLDQSAQDSAEELDYLHNVKNNANHLLTLIDNLLEQAQLESGQVTLQLGSCDLKQLITDIKSLFYPQSQQKNLQFETHLQYNLPNRLLIDELRFRQVLINLVANAMKYTEQGFVQVVLGWEEDRLEFTVVDSGPGISADSQQKIFAPFHRDSAAHAYPGVGLGLTISHHLVNLMGGDLKVESHLGEGSVFSGFIRAPLVQSSPTTYPNAIARILIAEDNVVIHELIEIYLKEGGYTVMNASNGEEAVQIALANHPDLILMDMQMPILDGYSAVQQLRAQQFTRPIIGLSASNLLADQNAALEAGCDHYLTKPVSIENLLTTIADALSEVPKT